MKTEFIWFHLMLIWFHSAQAETPRDNGNSSEASRITTDSSAVWSMITLKTEDSSLKQTEEINIVNDGTYESGNNSPRKNHIENIGTDETKEVGAGSQLQDEGVKQDDGTYESENNGARKNHTENIGIDKTKEVGGGSQLQDEGVKQDDGTCESGNTSPRKNHTENIGTDETKEVGGGSQLQDEGVKQDDGTCESGNNSPRKNHTENIGTDETKEVGAVGQLQDEGVKQDDGTCESGNNSPRKNHTENIGTDETKEVGAVGQLQDEGVKPDDDYDNINAEIQVLRKRESDTLPQYDNSHAGFGMDTNEQYYDFGFGIRIAPRVPFPDARVEPPVLTDLSCWECTLESDSRCMLKRCDTVLPYDGVHSPKGYSCLHAVAGGVFLSFLAPQVAKCSFAESSFFDPCEEVSKTVSLRNCRLCETDGCNAITSGLSKWLLALFLLISCCSCCCLCLIMYNRSSSCKNCNKCEDDCEQQDHCPYEDWEDPVCDYRDLHGRSEPEPYERADDAPRRSRRADCEDPGTYSEDGRRNRVSFGAGDRRPGRSMSPRHSRH